MMTAILAMSTAVRAEDHVMVATKGSQIYKDGAPKTLSLSLKEAQDYAVKQNRTLKNASLAVQEAYAARWQTIASMLPQVDGTYSYSDYLGYSATLGMGGMPIEINMPNVGALGVTASVGLNGQAIVGVLLNNVAIDMKKIALEKSESELRSSILSSYVSVLALRSISNLLDSSLNNIEHLETADHGGQQCVDHDGLQQRESNAPEGLTGVRAVDLSRLEARLVATLNTGHQHDHGIAEPHPDLDEHNEDTRAPAACDDLPGLLSGAEQCIDNTVLGIAEQGKEQTGNGSSSDDIRHIHNYLKEAFAGHLDTQIREPDCEQERQCDLRNKVAHPDNDGVLHSVPEGIVDTERLEIAFSRRCKDRLEVVQSDDTRSSGTVFAESQNECLDQRPKTENAIYDKERQNKDVAVLSVADGFDPSLCSCSHSAHPFKKKLVKITNRDKIFAYWEHKSQ